MKFFDDLFISYRGAGVIGTCMAVFVLASVIGLSLFAFDPSLSGIGGHESNAAVIARQEKEIGHLTHDLEDAEKNYYESGRLADEINRNSARQNAADAKLKEITAKLDQTQAALTCLQTRGVAYAKAYRQQVREKAVGEVLPTMDLPGGRHLEAAVVKKVDPAGIQVSFRDGSIRIMAMDLPEKVRERFQFDSEEMEAFLESEKKQNRQFAQEMDRGLEVAKTKNHQDKISRVEKQIAFLKDRVAACAQQYAVLRPNQNRNYNTLVALIQQVDADQRAIQKAEAELAGLKRDEAAKK
ncbi:hypothetical protein [Haloferula sp. BvORR071]|uniref:hypothetical protein n=1 Tax=Haloferula sp. BvORR071 TaxID=1396141 RepID=UPI0005561385|nr:hypothetical protein [Haloferula sp. BvORR071]